MHFPRAFIIAAALCLSGCATTAPQTVQTGTGQKVRIGYNGTIRHDDGWFVQVTEENGLWTIVDITAKPQKRRQDTHEILWVKRDRTQIEPAFEMSTGYKPTVNEIECSPFLHKETAYNGCNSRLTKADIGRSIGKNVVAAALTLGMASGTNRGIDHDLIQKIIGDTNLLAAVSTPASEHLLAVEDTNRTIGTALARSVADERAALLNARLKVPVMAAGDLASVMQRTAYAALRQQKQSETLSRPPARIGTQAYSEAARATALNARCARVDGTVGIHTYREGSLVIPAGDTRTVSALYCTANGMPWSKDNMALCMEADGKRVCDPSSPSKN